MTGNGHARNLGKEVRLLPTPRAIRRWEHIHGPAPRPTDDKRRLEPRFVEWMLGLPYGWVYVTGVSRTAQLRMLGNSVQVQVGTLVGNALRSVA